MLDIKYIVDNAQAFSASAKNRSVADHSGELVALYKEAAAAQQKMESLQQERNAAAKQKQSDEASLLLARARKADIAELDAHLTQLREQIEACAKKIPNLHHPDAPVGKEDKDDLAVKTVGTPRKFSFAPKDHVQLCAELDLADFEKAAAVSGPKFYYLKNQAVLLELALLRFGVDMLIARGFTIFQTPDLAKTSVVDGIGFNPRGAESNIYNLEDEPLSLVGTAEITLGGYYAGSVLDMDSLPIKMAGISHCFRREAGAAGQYSKGLYRVHQFTKLEMFVFCAPEASEAMHRELLAIEEAIYQALEIPYRVVDTCTGALGASAYRKFDIEAWMPGRGEGGSYGEVTSTSNCTDYQARRLEIRAQKNDPHNPEKKIRVFPHMLNGTAIAISRTLVALLENFQNADGSISMPKALVPYCGFDAIRSITSAGA